MSTIDDAKWHSESEVFPDDAPPENGGTHIGIFLAWLVQHELVSETLKTKHGEAVAAVKERTKTGRELLFSCLDGVLSMEDVSDEAQPFTKEYLTGDGDYFEDFDKVLGEEHVSLYNVEDNWSCYEVMSRTIDRRYAAFKDASLKTW